MLKPNYAWIVISCFLATGCTAKLGNETYKLNPETIQNYFSDEGSTASDVNSTQEPDTTTLTSSPLEATVMTLQISKEGSQGKHVKLNDRNVIFYYEAFSNISTPAHILAPLVSKDYRDSTDEFTRHDLLKEIKPYINKEMEKAKAAQRVMVKAKVNLGEYDFDKSAFATGMGSWSYIPFDDYVVAFENGKQFEYLPYDQNMARELSGHLRKSRVVTVTIYGKVVEATEKTYKRRDKKAVLIQAEQVNVVLDEASAYQSRSYNDHLVPGGGCNYDFTYCW